MTKVKIAADLQDACGESPVWDSRVGLLRWVDITGERFHTLPWPSQTIRTEKPGVPVSGFVLTDSEALVLAGTSGVWLWTAGEKPVSLATEYEGEPLAVNDCIADGQGRLLFGTTFFDGSSSGAPGSLYAIENDGSVRRLDTGFGLANGMGFSVDGRTFYLTDSVERRIYAYDYDERQGLVSNRRAFVQVSSDEGLPDGLTVDSEDFIWSAQWFGGCLCRYDPEGRLERCIAIPAKQTSSLTFGGPELSDIFVTSAAAPDALMLAPRHYQSMGPVGGPLFQLNVGIPGKPDYRSSLANMASRKEPNRAHSPA